MSSNLDGALRLSPLSPSTRSSPISDVDCSDDERGGKDPGFRKGNRGQSSLPCSSNDGHTILINRFFLPAVDLIHPSDFWRIYPDHFVLFEDIEQFCTIILRTLENLYPEDGDLKITARMIELISIHSRDKYLLSVTFLTKFQILSSTYIVDESTADTGYTKSWPGPKLYQSATCKNRLRNGGRPLFFVERDTVHIKLRERAHRLETRRLVPRIAGGVRN